MSAPRNTRLVFGSDLAKLNTFTLALYLPRINLFLVLNILKHIIHINLELWNINSLTPTPSVALMVMPEHKESRLSQRFTKLQEKIAKYSIKESEQNLFSYDKFTLR